MFAAGDIDHRWRGRCLCEVITILTYQDFEKEPDRLDFIRRAITEHRQSEEFKIAADAELYDRQENSTINAVTRWVFSNDGRRVYDPTSSNNRIASNFFHRLNTQRVSYLLGNGISFTKHITEAEQDGQKIRIDETKERFNDNFDTDVYKICYSGEIESKSYCYVTYDSSSGYGLHLFPFTEFVPLVDEYDGTLRAGLRYWSLDWDHRPVTVVLYEKDGITKYQTKPGSRGLDLMVVEPKHGYNIRTSTTEAEGTEIIGYENHFSDLPIIPYYAANEQSTLVGMKASIDAYDLIQSGFANDLQDCAQIYWLIGGSLGMTDDKLKEFRERLLYQHIAVADLDNSSVTPYTQEVPHNARQTFLTQMRSNIYEAFGGLDVSQLSGNRRTATEIEATYNPMDEEADAFESRVTDFLRRLLALIGVDDLPTYKRNRIANQYEQTQMIVLAADYLDRRTILEKLPWITVDEVETIMSATSVEDEERREADTDEQNDMVYDGNGGFYDRNSV